MYRLYQPAPDGQPPQELSPAETMKKISHIISELHKMVTDYELMRKSVHLNVFLSGLREEIDARMALQAKQLLIDLLKICGVDAETYANDLPQTPTGAQEPANANETAGTVHSSPSAQEPPSAAHAASTSEKPNTAAPQKPRPGLWKSPRKKQPRP